MALVDGHVEARIADLDVGLQRARTAASEFLSIAAVGNHEPAMIEVLQPAPHAAPKPPVEVSLAALGPRGCVRGGFTHAWSALGDPLCLG